MKKNKFDLLFEKVMDELHPLERARQEIEVMNKTTDDIQQNEKNSKTIDSEKERSVIEELETRLALIEKAISFPWINEPNEGLLKLKIKYNNTANTNDILFITRNIIEMPLRAASREHIISAENIEKYTNKINILINEIKEYPYFKLSNLAGILDTMFNDELINSIETYEKSINDAKTILNNLSEQPIWFDLTAYKKQFQKINNEVNDKLNVINTQEITDELREKYFVDYGMLNRSPGTPHVQHDDFSLASQLHKRDLTEHPELHKINKHGDTYSCSCGFKYSADSSD